MDITRNVVLDLLPLYQAGEASADTVRLVEAYLENEPAFARDAVRASRLVDAPPSALSQEHEVRTLRRTRRLLQRDRWLMAGGIFFAMVPLSSVHTGSIDWFLLRDAPIVAMTSFMIALAFWIAFGASSHRDHVRS